MSAQNEIRRATPVSIRQQKGREKIVVLTAYTAPQAKLLDEHVDVLMVGDSLGMVIYGMETTLPVTLEMMIAHGRAVVDASKRALVVVDMPFASYQASLEQAFTNCARVLRETHCGAVKMEGGMEMAETIAFLSERGVPVMAHVGLQPQHVRTLGSYKAQGRLAAERERIIEDALAVEAAGAFAVVLEGIEESLGNDITGRLSIPTIGIGASPTCDGQVLVVDDMLGLTEKPPRFVKKYTDLAKKISDAAAAYAKDVRAGAFPAPEHCVTMPPKPQVVKPRQKKD
jgi:3-methyl-2-oxobutanoate hydroxymethyltransferase